MDKGIRTSREYKHLMVLLGVTGLTDRDSRLQLASKVLGRDVSSFTSLNMSEVRQIVEALTQWKYIQEMRFQDGILFSESLHYIDVISDINNDGLTKTGGVLPDKQTRKAYDMPNPQDVNEMKSAFTIDMDQFNSVADTLESRSPGIIETRGRWDNWRVIPSPSPFLGLTLGIGGIPRGKIVQLWGAKHAGKSMLSQQIAAQAQRVGIPTVLFDTEGAVDPDFARNLGVDWNSKMVTVKTPANLEQLCQDLRKIASSGALVIIDSIASVESHAEFERNIGKESPRVGGNAMLWKSTFSIVRPMIQESGTTIILINQVRAKIGAGNYEDPQKPFGPEAIHHATDVMIKVTKAKELNSTFKTRGYFKSNFWVGKNRLGESRNSHATFKPGFSYNRSIDLIYAAKAPVSEGSEVTYEEMAGYPIATGVIPNDSGELVKKKDRWTIKIDPVMKAAILKDEPDFDEAPEITPNHELLDSFLRDNQQLPEIKDVPPTEDEPEFIYFPIPDRFMTATVKWFRNHPTAREVVIERLYAGLNHHHDFVSE